MQWFKYPSDRLAHEIFTTLSDAEFGFYTRLECLRCQKEIRNNPKFLASLFHKYPQSISHLLKSFEKIGLIIFEDDEIVLPYWEEAQGHGKPGSVRQKEYRVRRKQDEALRNGDVTVTKPLCNGDGLELELDKELELKPKLKDNSETKVSSLQKKVDLTPEQQTVFDYCEMKWVEYGGPPVKNAALSLKTMMENPAHAQVDFKALAADTFSWLLNAEKRYKNWAAVLVNAATRNGWKFKKGGNSNGGATTETARPGKMSESALALEAKLRKQIEAQQAAEEAKQEGSDLFQ